MKAMHACLLVALGLSFAAEAQMRPGRGGGGGTGQRPPSMENDGPGSSYYRGGSALAADPVAALERELPSLRVDLKITREQAPYWESFERGVRDVAELGRARQKHLLAPLEADKPPPPALNLVAAWANDDRARAGAMDALVAKLESLQQVLDDAQRKEVDRRVVLSQTEPLNVPPPSEERGRRALR